VAKGLNLPRRTEGAKK